jgi:hypothetical protein
MSRPLWKRVKRRLPPRRDFRDLIREELLHRGVERWALRFHLQRIEVAARDQKSALDRVGSERCV